MNKQSIENTSNRILIGAAIVLVIVCILLRTQMLGLDNYLFNHLLAALSARQNAMAAASPPLDALLIGCESIAALVIGLKLSTVPRGIAFVQLLVITMFVQWFFYNSLNASAHPLSAFLSVAFGGSLGYVFRRLQLRDDRFNSQYLELTLRNRELQEARLLLVRQDEVERRMLAADLHDQVLNDLKALKQSIDSWESDGTAEESAKVQELLQRAMGEVREVMDSLCPSALEHLGLGAAIEDCGRRAAQRAGFKVRFKNSAEEELLEKLSVVETSLLYRLAQESMTNICKHAGATKVKINVGTEGKTICISISDDGKGIPLEVRKNESRGMRYMRLRADLIGATVAWRPGEEDKGTTVEIRMDMANRNGHANTDS